MMQKLLHDWIAAPVAERAEILLLFLLEHQCVIAQLHPHQQSVNQQQVDTNIV